MIKLRDSEKTKHLKNYENNCNLVKHGKFLVELVLYTYFHITSCLRAFLLSKTL